MNKDIIKFSKLESAIKSIKTSLSKCIYRYENYIRDYPYTKKPRDIGIYSDNIYVTHIQPEEKEKP